MSIQKSLKERIEDVEINQELWWVFCNKMKERLSEITSPVANNPANRSYDALADTITNVILFEMSLHRKPWDEISKREVKIPTREDHIEEISNYATEEELANIFLNRLSGAVSYNDRNINDTPKKTLSAMALYVALKNYIETKY